jgi:hypothetical protein
VVTHRSPAVIALALAAFGCSSGISLGSNDESAIQGSGGAGGGGGGQGGGSTTSCPDPEGEDWVDLIELERTINPGEELVDCAEEVAPRSILVKALRLKNTKAYQSRLSDEHSLCHLGPVDVHGHGARFVMHTRAGADEVRLPAGHALRVTGSPLNLLLHVIDVTSQPLTGSSVTEVLLADESEVTTEVSSLSPEVEQELSVVPLAGSGGDTCNGPWTELIAGDWTAPPHSVAVHCVRKTLAADVDVRALRVTNPLGTYGAVLGVGAPSGPDGIAPCTAAPPPTQSVVASTVGTREVSFPNGSGVQFVARQQLVFELHVVNDGDTVLTGASSIETR